MVPAAYAGASRGTILATRGWTFRSLRYTVYLTVAETVILSLFTGHTFYERYELVAIL